MPAFNQIQKNIRDFIRKYFLNELFKGIILFAVFGFLYLLITALIEYFLWLPPVARKYLFYAQWIVLGLFFLLFILRPLLNLLGLRRELSDEKAALIIGNFFPEIQDKLLNTLQLNQQSDGADLLWASIEQKSEQLKHFRFSKAVDFKQNFKYLPLLLIPFLIAFLLRISHFDQKLSEGYQRVLSYNQNFAPPLPYSIFLPDSLQTMQGSDFKLQVSVRGEKLPQNLFLVLDDKQNLLKKENDTLFSFYFPVLQEPLHFSLSDGKHHLGYYQINIIYPPVIQDIKITLNYPSYLHKKPETRNFTGNLTIPQSTQIKWNLHTSHTESIYFSINGNSTFFPVENQFFSFQKTAEDDFTYQLQPLNSNVKNIRPVTYKVSVIKDEYPKLKVIEHKDTLNLQNYYQLTASDDYALSKLRLVYTNLTTGEKRFKNIPVPQQSFYQTVFVFPGDLDLTPGDSYEYFFQVFDNDAVHHFKSTNSKTFIYNKLTDKQFQQQNLIQQNKSLSELNQLQQQFKQQQKQLDKINEKIASQKSLDWQSKKQLENTLEKNRQADEFFKQAVKKYKDLLDKLPNQDSDEQKEALKKRLEELERMEKKKKMLDELKELAEKLKKEDLIEKLNDLQKYSEHQEKSLERILELTKKYYMQQKIQKLANQLDSLSKKQTDLARKNTDKPSEQDSLNKQMSQLQKQMDSLQQMNKELKKPMPLPDHQTEMEDIKMDMQKASENLQKNQPSSANKMQQKAANKMQKLSKNMAMMMQGGAAEQNQEDIKTLQALLKSLLHFSFKQESLLTDLYEHKGQKYLSQQLLTQSFLKKYFKHINDSLYTLALRNPKISQKILDEAFEIQISLDKSLSFLSENQIYNTQNSAQYILKGANTLADFLSNALDDMKNSSQSMGQGQGKKKKGESFSLPDIIKKQGESISQMQEALKKKQGQQGKQNGNKSGKNQQGQNMEEESARQYELYKQQQQIKEDLQQLGDRFSDQAQQKRISNLIKQMDDLQKRLLSEGITQSTLNKMIQLQHELLKLKNATFTQHEDDKRQCITNNRSFKGLDSLFFNENNQFQPQNESLKRTQIPVNQNVKKKIIQYLN